MASFLLFFCVISMIIKISNLNNGEHHFTIDESAKKNGLEEPFFGNFLLNLDLEKSNSQIIVNAELALSVKFECDRCGEDYETRLKTNFQLVFLFGEEPEVTGDVNIKYLPYDAEKIDISQELLDYAMLALPMRKLCREDCKGLCYRCGTNLNNGECNCKKEEVDIRWQPLLDLKNKLNNN